MLPRFLVSLMLLVASLNGIAAVPMQKNGMEAKRDELGDIISGIVSAAVEVLGPSAVAQAEGPIESFMSGIAGFASAIASGTIPNPSVSPSSTSTVTQGAASAIFTLPGAALNQGAAPTLTNVLTLPGGALWTPPAAISTSVVSVLPTQAPTPTPAKRDNILSDIANSGLASLANEVLGALPSGIAAPASSLVAEFIGSTPSTGASGPASTDATSNAAVGRLEASRGSFMAIAMIASALIGSIIVL